MSRVEYRHGESPAATADLPDGCAAAVITDPPYGTARPGDWHGYGRRPAQVERRAHTQTLIRADTDLSMLEAVAPEMRRLLAPGGVAIVFCAPSKRRLAEDALSAGGLTPIFALPWDKGAPGLAYKVRHSYEDAILAVVGDYDPWDVRQPIVVPIRYPRLQQTEHPNEKPVGMLRQYVAWACPNGGLVVDHFAGIASLGVACVAEGCDYVGVECDPEWWPVAERRIADALQQPHHSIAQHNLFPAQVA